LIIPIASRVFPALSYTNFKVSGLILRSLIHFELILVQGERHGSSFSFLQADNHFSQQYLLKRLSTLHHMFLEPLSKISGHSYVASYPGPPFCSTGLHMFLCLYHAVFIAMALQYSLKSGIVIPPAMLFLLSIHSLGYSWSLVFPNEL
jgi:hypothetical protein